MNNLRDTLANVSLYDVKAYVRKAQNAVLNFSDAEAKVREATNNEPWGAPTSLMQEIADATHSYDQFQDIMPFVYRRFTDKSASSWRQIYKALQLLDFLIKNGSPKVVDYARSHTEVIEMLRNFHYIDHHGQDQGLNIRNRAEDMLGLLSDVDKIRAERKRAQALNAKHIRNNRMAGSTYGSSRYFGGIGSDSQRLSFGSGAARNRVFGDGGTFDGTAPSGATYSAAHDDGFEEYTPTVAVERDTSPYRANPTVHAADQSAVPIGDDAPLSSVAKSSNSAANDDDDFAEFQGAPATTAQPKTTDLILDLFDAPSIKTDQSSQTPLTQAPLLQPTRQSLSQTVAVPAMQPTSQLSTPAGKTGADQGLATLSSGARAYGGPHTEQKQESDIFGSLWESTKKGTLGTGKGQRAEQKTGVSKQSIHLHTSATGSSSPPSKQPASDDLLIL